jgi:hypothetical protein
MGRSPRSGNRQERKIPSIFFLYLGESPLRALISISSAAMLRKVVTWSAACWLFPIWRSRVGFLPALACSLMRSRSARAIPNPTAGYWPSDRADSFRCAPSFAATVKRSCHSFTPCGLTTRRSPPPSGRIKALPSILGLAFLHSASLRRL